MRLQTTLLAAGLATMLAVPTFGAETTKVTPDLSEAATVEGLWDTAETGPNSPYVNPLDYLSVKPCKSVWGQGRVFCVFGVRLSRGGASSTESFFGELAPVAPTTRDSTPGRYFGQFIDSGKATAHLQGDTLSFEPCTQPTSVCRAATWTRRTR